MKIFKLLSVLFVVSFLFTGCLYNFIVPEPEIPTDPDNPDAPEVSFSADIIPIWNNNSNCTSCHKTGGTAPDLTPDNAYQSVNTTKYINRSTPEESKIYLVPHPDESGHTQKKYTTNQANMVLLWIKQGAKNN